MRALVIYESMYGNTHLVANAVAEGLRTHAEATVVPVGDADGATVAGADLVVIGGPTHAHGMSRAVTRSTAAAAAGKPGSALVLDTGAGGPGLREWFGSVGDLAANAAAFDTRTDIPVLLSGRASKGIARQLRHHGAKLISEPQSFLVTKDNHLEPGEEARAREWGERLAVSLAPAAVTAPV